MKHILEMQMMEVDVSGVIEGADSLLDDDGKPKRTGSILNRIFFM